MERQEDSRRAEEKVLDLGDACPTGRAGGSRSQRGQCAEGGEERSKEREGWASVGARGISTRNFSGCSPEPPQGKLLRAISSFLPLLDKRSF